MKYLIKDNFLDSDTFNKLLDEFPTEWGRGLRSHKDIFYADPAWQKLSDAWKQFYNVIHTWSFWKPFVYELGVQDIVPPFDETYREVRGGSPPLIEPPVSYARADIGLGYEGYGKVNGGRGPHIDNPQRIISGLLYFTDQSTIEGGEFQFCDKAGAVQKTVDLKLNRAVLSVQDNDAWHMVNPLRKGERRAVYFALSATKRMWSRC